MDAQKKDTASPAIASQAQGANATSEYTTPNASAAVPISETVECVARAATRDPTRAPNAPAAPKAANRPGPEWKEIRASNGATTWLLREMVPTTAIANSGNRTSRTRM